MSQQLAAARSSSIRSICFGVLVLLLLINQLGFSQARYLPTRADESRKEMLKAMLKELMDMPQTYDTDSRYASGVKSRYGSAYPAEPSYLAKRSVPSSEHLINRLAPEN